MSGPVRPDTTMTCGVAAASESSSLRRARKAGGKRMFSAAELRTLLDAMDGKPINVEGVEKPVTRPADRVREALFLLSTSPEFATLR